jgi:hypothetical protein
MGLKKTKALKKLEGKRKSESGIQKEIQRTKDFLAAAGYASKNAYVNNNGVCYSDEAIKSIREQLSKITLDPNMTIVCGHHIVPREYKGIGHKLLMNEELFMNALKRYSEELNKAMGIPKEILEQN